jgi:hypothetical protein
MEKISPYKLGLIFVGVVQATVLMLAFELGGLLIIFVTNSAPSLWYEIFALTVPIAYLVAFMVLYLMWRKTHTLQGWDISHRKPRCCL